MTQCRLQHDDSESITPTTFESADVNTELQIMDHELEVFYYTLEHRNEIKIRNQLGKVITAFKDDVKNRNGYKILDSAHANLNLIKINDDTPQWIVEEICRIYHKARVIKEKYFIRYEMKITLYLPIQSNVTSTLTQITTKSTIKTVTEQTTSLIQNSRKRTYPTEVVDHNDLSKYSKTQ